MAWDFSTDPEYAAKLDWAREFVRAEVWPIETVAHDLTQEQLERIYAPLQDEVRRQGLWAAHLDPELGGQRCQETLPRREFGIGRRAGADEEDERPLFCLVRE